MQHKDDQPIDIEEHVEVISTDDDRLKIIGEELGNDTGRAIFTTISRGISSPNELSKVLGVSLPLVNWHINRLMQVGLVRVEELKMSSKNRPVKYYGPAKTVLVIMPAESDERRPRFDILSRLNRNIVTAVSFVSGASVIYAIKRFIIDGSAAGVQLADPDALAATSGSDITVAVLGGAAIAAAVILSARLAGRRDAAKV
jgi:DNA-binding transcriptional ArsR family regulator